MRDVSCFTCKEAVYGKDLILADRDMVESESDDILRDADKEDVALLVVGDPFGYETPTTSLLIIPLDYRIPQSYNSYRHNPPRSLSKDPRAGSA